MSAQRLTSQEYLEQLRSRRLNRAVPSATDATATTAESFDNSALSENQFFSNTQEAFPEPASTTEELALEPQSGVMADYSQEAVAEPILDETIVSNVDTPMPNRTESAPSPTLEKQESNSDVGQNIPPVNPEVLEAIAAMDKPIPEQKLLEWKAPSRPFKKRNRQFYTTIVIIVFLISLILFFAGQFLPIAVVIAVAFLGYVLSSVPPEIIPHQITTHGIRIENHLYHWDELGNFWFTQKYKEPVLNIEVGRFPFRLTILIGDLPQDLMTELMQMFLIEGQPKPTFFDKAADWIQRKIPLDTD